MSGEDKNDHKNARDRVINTAKSNFHMQMRPAPASLVKTNENNMSKRHGTAGHETARHGSFAAIINGSKREAAVKRRRRRAWRCGETPTACLRPNLLIIPMTSLVFVRRSLSLSLCRTRSSTHFLQLSFLRTFGFWHLDAVSVFVFLLLRVLLLLLLLVVLSCGGAGLGYGRCCLFSVDFSFFTFCGLLATSTS